MKSLLSHIAHCITYWRIILLIFSFQFILSSTIGLQMNQILDSSIGHSLSLEKFKEGFNYTVFQDFMNAHGESMSALFGMMKWLVMIYLIFSTFITAGSIFSLSRDDDSISTFFQGGVRYFSRFLLLDIIFLVFILICWGIGFATIGYLFGIAPYRFDNELVFLRWTLLIAIVLFFLTSALTIWKISAKFHFIEKMEGSGLFQSVKQGFKSFWRSKWSLWFLAFVFLAISILLSVITFAAGSTPLLVMILVTNAVLILKIFWRLVFYKTIGVLNS